MGRPRKNKDATAEVTVEAKAPAVTPVINPPARLFISKEEAARMLAYGCEVRMHDAEAQLAKLTHDVLVAKLDPKGMIAEQAAKFRNSSGQWNDCKKRYEDFKKSIGDRLGIDLSKYSYDDDTGELVSLEDMANGA